jgi:hypothetical protein
MPSRLEITRKIIQDLAPDQYPSEQWAEQHWWANIRSSGGLRLSSTGLAAFESLKLESWHYPLLSITPRMLIILDQKLTCPYYIKMNRRPEITLFGSKEATLFGLYGDAGKFLGMLNRD